MKKGCIMKPIFLDYQPFGLTKKNKVWFYDNFPNTLPKKSINHYSYILLIYDDVLSDQLITKINDLLTPFSKNIGVYPFTYSPKSLKSLSKIWGKIVDFTPDVLVGAGGGTVSDLVGFAASTYQRGIPHILFPTTVLGMIDASLGGKTAIDFHGVKNCIGAVHYPKLIINVMEFLKSLPKNEFFSGFSEAVKAAVLFDSKFFLQLEQYAEKQDFSYANPQLLEVMKKSASLKMLNSEAPTEHKIKLLYGHAVGHALEILADGRLRHGDAVSIGMTIEGVMACLLKYWDINEWRQQTKLLLNLSLPVNFPNTCTINAVINKMSLYKKLVRDDAYGFIFPCRIGDVVKHDKEYVTYIPILQTKKLLKQAISIIDKELLSLQ